MSIRGVLRLELLADLAKIGLVAPECAGLDFLRALTDIGMVACGARPGASALAKSADSLSPCMAIAGNFIGRMANPLRIHSSLRSQSK